ncbi:uncharacterized protein Rcd6 isoform X1 [Cherax quadricarinatus]
MALLSTCLCCSLLLGSIISGVYTIIVYVAAIVVTVCMIVTNQQGWGEAVGQPRPTGPPVPAAAYLLCFCYGIAVVASVWLLMGLYKKRKSALLLWLFTIALLCFPEMIMVTFMTFSHWRISSSYGVVDLTFYVVRATLNLWCVLCVQSVYVEWRDQPNCCYTLKTQQQPGMSAEEEGAVNGEAVLVYNNPAFMALTETTLPPPLPPSRPSTPRPITRSYSAASEYSSRNTAVQQQVLGSTAAVASSVVRTGIPGWEGIPGWDTYLSGQSHSEFNAALFNPASGGLPPLVTGYPSNQSIYQQSPHVSYVYPPTTTTTEDNNHYHCYYPFSTQSLDRRRYGVKGHGCSWEDRVSQQAGVLATSGFTRPTVLVNPGFSRPGVLVNPGVLMNPSFTRPAVLVNPGFTRTRSLSTPVFNRHIYDSRSSLGADSDDFSQYRDVAL